jgi:hypothetical protein
VESGRCADLHYISIRNNVNPALNAPGRANKLFYWGFTDVAGGRGLFQAYLWRFQCQANRFLTGNFNPVRCNEPMVIGCELCNPHLREFYNLAVFTDL